MNTQAPNRDLQADFQSIDTRMMIKFKDAIESDNKKRRRSARGFMSKYMDSDPNNPRRFPKLWAAMCDELEYQMDIRTTPISQIRQDMKDAGYTSETIERFEQQHRNKGESI